MDRCAVGLAATLGTGAKSGSARNELRLYFVTEGIASTAASFLMIGIFFFTASRFQWGLAQNFALAAVQGAVYVVGALLAGKLSKRIGRRELLVRLYLGMATVSACSLFGLRPGIVVGVLLAYTFLVAGSWPQLESLVSSGATPAQLSRRLGFYNLVWAITGSLAVAVNGTVIKYWVQGVFLIPMCLTLICAGLIWQTRARKQRAVSEDVEPGGDSHAHASPEPGLLSQRRLALILSRISLPASYALIYSVSALMPLLPAVRELDPSKRTLVGSAWMMGRCLSFVILGATVFWHTRPKTLLYAAVLMLLAFAGMTVRPSDVLGLGGGRALDLTALVVFQVVLGLMLGMIYCGSLYFGMVLSEGSAEHGGYHEALIGLGSVLGPGTGALVLALTGGNIVAGVLGVTTIVSVSVLTAAVAAYKARGQTIRPDFRGSPKEAIQGRAA